MLALSWLDVPAAGPLIKRMLSKAGSSALIMELANTASEIQKNMAIGKDIDPKRQWYDGLNQIGFHLSNLGGGLAFGGVHELTSMRPNTEEPGVVNVPVTPAAQTGRAQRPIPAAPLQQPQQQQEEVQPGAKAAPVEENGEQVNVPPAGAPPIPSEHEPEQTVPPVSQAPENPHATPQAVPASGGAVVNAPEPGAVTSEHEKAPVAEQATPSSPSWLDLTGRQRSDRTKLTRSGFLKAYQDFKGYFDALDTDIVEHPETPAGLATFGDGRTSLAFNPEKLAQMLHEFGREGRDVPSFSTILQHELFHAAVTDLQRQRWEDELLAAIKVWCDAERGRRSELAKAVGTSPQTVSHWFAGRKTPTLEQGLVILEILRRTGKTSAKRR